MDKKAERHPVRCRMPLSLYISISLPYIPQDRRGSLIRRISFPGGKTVRAIAVTCARGRAVPYGSFRPYYGGALFRTNKKTARLKNRAVLKTALFGPCAGAVR